MTHSFEALIAPITEERFFSSHYEQAPLVITRNQPDHYRDLLDIAAIDRFLAAADHHHPDVYLVNAAEPDLKPQDYCDANQRIDLRRLYDKFATGSTIVLFGIATRIPALKALCRALENRFSVACDTNIYLTPPGAHGLRPHYDNHDVFVLQVEGRKSWVLFDSPIALPMPGQSFAQLRPEAGPVSQRFDLNPGDLLYCPRGLMHDAEAGDGVSLHITLSLKGPTWTALMIEAVADLALRDVEFRRLLPVGYAGTVDRDAAKSHFLTLIDRLRDGTAIEDLLDRQSEAFVATRPPVPTGHLRALLSPPEINEDTLFHAWPDLIFRLDIADGQVRLVWQGPDLTLPAFTEPALRFALTRPAYRLGELPGDLDVAGQRVLLGRLCREGLIQGTEKRNGVGTITQSFR